MKTPRVLALAARGQTGIGMIEVLVAILVSAVGFLGMAALQVRALATNNSAMARSMATVASYSMLDAMRADRTAVLSGNYDRTVTDCDTQPSTEAEKQLKFWCLGLKQMLGDNDATQGRVDCDAAVCTVSVQFDDRRVGGVGANTQTVVVRAAL